jgi:hypothetical protein
VRRSPETQVLRARFWDLDGQDDCFFFFGLKLSLSTNMVFFFFFCFSVLNCRRTWFFFSLSVRPRLSVTTCSTLHPSDVSFFTSFNGEDLVTFTSCSIFKTFVPTYLLLIYLFGCTYPFCFCETCDGWMNE